MSLKEIDCRRPDFVPGSAVALGDGQEWQLRRPILRFVPDDSHQSGFQVRLLLSGDDGFAELMKKRKALIDMEEGGTIGDLAGIELAVTRKLLTANYDLPPESIADLLQFSYDETDDPEGAAIRIGCMAVAEGYGPKPSPAGAE